MSQSRPWLDQAGIESLKEWHAAYDETKMNITYLSYKACGGENPETTTSARKEKVAQLNETYYDLLAVAEIKDESDRARNAKDFAKIIKVYKKLTEDLFKIVEGSKNQAKKLAPEQLKELTAKKLVVFSVLDQFKPVSETKTRSKSAERKTTKSKTVSSVLADPTETSMQSKTMPSSSYQESSYSTSRAGASISRGANESEYLLSGTRSSKEKINSITLPGGQQSDMFSRAFFGSPEASVNQAPTFGRTYSQSMPDYSDIDFSKRGLAYNTEELESKYNLENTSNEETSLESKNSTPEDLLQQIKAIKAAQERNAAEMQMIKNAQEKQNEIAKEQIACLQQFINDSKQGNLKPDPIILQELIVQIVQEQVQALLKENSKRLRDDISIAIPSDNLDEAAGLGSIMPVSALRPASANTSRRSSMSSIQSDYDDQAKSSKLKKALAITAGVASSLFLVAILIKVHATGVLSSVASSIATLGLGSIAAMHIVIPAIMVVALLTSMTYLFYSALDDNKTKLYAKTSELSPANSPRNFSSSHGDMLRRGLIQAPVFASANQEESRMEYSDENSDYSESKSNRSSPSKSRSISAQQVQRQLAQQRLLHAVKADRDEERKMGLSK